MTGVDVIGMTISDTHQWVIWQIHLNGLNAPIIRPFLSVISTQNLQEKKKKKNKPWDKIGDEDEDDEEMEDDLLCSWWLINDWEEDFWSEFFSAISASDQIPFRFFLSTISFSSILTWRSIRRINQRKEKREKSQPGWTSCCCWIRLNGDEKNWRLEIKELVWLFDEDGIVICVDSSSDWSVLDSPPCLSSSSSSSLVLFKNQTN